MVPENYCIIVRTWSWFESIRKALRVSRELNSRGAQEALDIGIIGVDLSNVLSKIMEEGRFKGGDLKRMSGIFENRIEVHRAEILSPIVGKDGKIIDVARHNGIEEIWSSMEQDAYQAKNRQITDNKGDVDVWIAYRNPFQYREQTLHFKGSLEY